MVNGSKNGQHTGVDLEERRQHIGMTISELSRRAKLVDQRVRRILGGAKVKPEEEAALLGVLDLAVVPELRVLAQRLLQVPLEPSMRDAARAMVERLKAEGEELHGS